MYVVEHVEHFKENEAEESESVKQKLACTAHILRGFSGSNALLLFRGKFEGKKVKGRPRRTWIVDLLQEKR